MKRLMISGLFGGALLFLNACGPCFAPAPPPEDIAHRQATPVSPLTAPAVQTPTFPAGQPAFPPDSQSPASPLPVPAPGPDGIAPPKALTLGDIQAIEPGMTYEEVYAELGHPGMLIAGTDARNNVYRWSEAGMSFMGRFEDGILVRKNVITDETAEQPEDPDVLRFDRALYNAIQPGMTFDAVMGLIGVEAQPISADSDSSVTIYKWTDEFGSNITARFEDLVLKRKSGLISTPEQISRETIAAEDPLEDHRPGDEEAAAAPRARTSDTQALDEAPVEAHEDQDAELAWETRAQPTLPPAQRPRVHVAGQTRRNREAAADPASHSDRSFRPRAKLPDFTRRIRGGSYEIRIFNTTNSQARVAVISGESGAELTVAAQEQGAVTVPQGDYRVYFIYDDTPHLLHQGSVIPIQQMLTDFAVYLVGDSYDVGLLDRSRDRSGRRR